MKLTRATAVLAFATLAVAACSSKDTAPVATNSGADANAAASAPAISSGAEPTANDISNYKLDMDRMTKYAAAIKGFGALAKTDSVAAEAMSSDANGSTAQMIARLDGNAPAMNVLRQAGLSAKDYVWITAAWLQAAMTQGILESNPNAKLPEGQNPQNMEFLKAHKAELKAMTKDRGMGQ